MSPNTLCSFTFPERDFSKFIYNQQKKFHLPSVVIPATNKLSITIPNSQHFISAEFHSLLSSESTKVSGENASTGSAGWTKGVFKKKKNLRPTFPTWEKHHKAVQFCKAKQEFRAQFLFNWIDMLLWHNLKILKPQQLIHLAELIISNLLLNAVSILPPSLPCIL